MKSARRTTPAAAAAVVLATAGGLLAVTTAPASAAVSCASPVFKRQFYANTSFSGTPKKTDCDNAIDQSWSGAPVSGLPKDNFGVRWTVTRDFGSGGPFALSATGLDGMRVYVDGVRKIDLWKNVSTTVKKTANVTIPSGRHTLRVDYANWTGAAKVKVTYAPRTSADVDKVKPLVPTGTSVSYDKATGKAKATWAKNKEMDLAGYRVYRRLKGTPFGTKPLTTTTSTSYTDSTLPATGDTYYYEVRAYDKAGNESGGTPDQAAVTADRTAPAAATGATALGTTAGNSVTWQASSSTDVDHYEVWGAPVGQSDPDGPHPVWGISWTDVTADAGTAYAYKVQAVDTAGNFAPVSDPATVTRPVASAVPAPTGVTGTPADASTEVTWTPADATGYRVYRRTDVNGAWSLVGTASGTSYEDTSAPKGKAFYYVAAVDAQGADSVPSTEVTVDRLTPATATGPAAPKLTLVTNGVPARSPIQVTAAPGTGDEGRVLKGYSWEISGACGSSGTQFSTTGTLSWTAPWNGPCVAEVYAVDAYGRQGTQSASVEFFSGR
ncbi:fibronectin type 3 domain-containing protein [Streptomyces sp. SAI-144]|uniref:PA14 domain-containing protein n=1 Tax=unclassified Streptomyces TaxID=2593676 RepID=UPI00247403F8|nr:MULTISPECIES: PA14 domain-containing protein [unclassified Streptomyces]MDH6441224.1 fibronectin type 3 domain-containing protein [Streptomyces sp. SAI-144]MDH6488542.1 fibronectin type 3 domain-containing protein [Streptomyces sp. SAI-127]